MTIMQSKLVFLLRAYNDLDHNAPIANFLLEKGANVLFVNIDSNVDDDDYRIEILRRHRNFHYLKVTNWNFTKDKPAKTFLAYAERIFYKIFLHSSTSLVWNLLTTLWIRKNQVVRDNITEADCVFFEWGRPQQRGVAALAVYRLTKAYEIPAIALPHGCNIFAKGGSNSAVRKAQIEFGSRIKDKPFWYYNYYCVQNPTRKLQLESNIGSPRNIVAIGSLRFSDDWRAEMKRSISVQPRVHKTGLKVTLMEFQIGYGTIEGELTRMIGCIESMSGVSFIIKRSTREGKSLGLSSNNIVVGNEYHSMSLIKESDCVIAYGSSIAIEVLLQEKLLISPSYLGLNESFFEKNKIGLIVQSTDELQAVIKHISSDQRAYLEAIRDQNAKLELVLKEYICGEYSEGPEAAIMKLLDSCGVRAQ